MSFESTDTKQLHPLEEKRPIDECTTLDDVDIYEGGYDDPVYQAKALVLNRAMREIGMGRYQWYLFVAAGFGWFNDSACLTSIGLILLPVVNEFHFNGPLLILALNIGLLAGGIFWGLGSDVWGRRLSFHLTLLIAGTFCLSAAGSPNFVTLASLLAVGGIGAGGNLPVDAVILLDFIPSSHQYILTTLSVWSSMGQLISSLAAWPLMVHFTCSSHNSCEQSNNMGWRYLFLAFGGLTLLFWGFRFLAFTLLESPRFLSAIGKEAEAVRVIHGLARYNGKTTTLTVKELETPGHIMDRPPLKPRTSNPSEYARHIKALFATPKMAWSTSLLMTIWGLNGLSTTLYQRFLPYLLAIRGAAFGDGSLYITYRNQAILSLIAVVASLFAGWVIERPHVGRRGTVTIFAGLTGAFLYASTTSKTSNQFLAWNCAYTFCTQTMSATMGGMSAEVFPAKDRGTGKGLVIAMSRFFGVIAPIIALYTNLATVVPVYVSGGLVIAAGILSLFLPYEPRGKASI